MSELMNIGQTVLGRYEVDDLVSQGGQAIIGKARDLGTGMIVAVKQLSACPGEKDYSQHVARFLREAQIRLGHPCIVDPLCYGEEDGRHYIIYPFIDGLDLELICSNGQTLPLGQGLSILDQLADALSVIHAAGIVHRDIKPGNIILRPEGRIALVDFGICRKPREATITSERLFIGSLPWTSPEQLDNAAAVDHRSDLYSLGAVGYYLLTGQFPVQRTSDAETKEAIRNYTPPAPSRINPTVPHHVDLACVKLLAKRPDLRFQSAQEFRLALRDNQPDLVQVVCPSCGAPFQPGANFCSTCGARSGTQPAPVRCFACGSAVGDAGACPSCRRSFSHTEHTLHFRSGSLAGEVFRIPEGCYEVGRLQLCSRDQHISRRHVFVNCVNGTVYVQDAGSANKTLVAGQLADRPVPLVVGQDFCIASNTASYSSN